MAKFPPAYELTMKLEAGYADNPLDRGKETFAGISRKANPKWPGWAIVDAAKQITTEPKELDKILFADHNLMTLVRALYKGNYWDANRLDLFASQHIANEVFDTGVNCGTVTAAKMLQEAMNLLNNRGKLYPDILVDGVIGPNTLRVLARVPDLYLLHRLLNGLQIEHYVNVMRKDPSQEVFARNWLLTRVDFSLTRADFQLAA